MINCTCTVIQSHNEEGEIEFCPLHEAAKDMYTALIDCRAELVNTLLVTHHLEGHDDVRLTSLINCLKRSCMLAIRVMNQSDRATSKAEGK